MGFHSGPAMGVVAGNNIPNYCIMSDTGNLARWGSWLSFLPFFIPGWWRRWGKAWGSTSAPSPRSCSTWFPLTFTLINSSFQKTLSMQYFRTVFIFPKVGGFRCDYRGALDLGVTYFPFHMYIIDFISTDVQPKDDCFPPRQTEARWKRTGWLGRPLGPGPSRIEDTWGHFGTRTIFRKWEFFGFPGVVRLRFNPENIVAADCRLLTFKINWSWTFLPIYLLPEIFIKDVE